MSRHFLSKTVLRTPICRLWYVYVLPLACLLWISSVSLHRPPCIHLTSATVTAIPAPVAAAGPNGNTVTGDIPGAHGDNVAGDAVASVVDRDGRRADGITDAAVENSRRRRPGATRPPSDLCAGRYVYVHDLPRRFNADMLRDCGTLSRWTNMCRSTSNAGLGPPLRRSGGVLPGSGWYATDQFALDVIFYNRMKRYPCLTKNSTAASAVYVPFFAGLDVARYLWGYNATFRDAAALDLTTWLRSRREWRVMGGKDHFLTAGRIAWDFRRSGDSDPDWGNKLLLMPEARNMSVLVLESGPRPGNDISVPYPTYFHPSRQSQVVAWQRRMRGAKRPWLFSFAGAPRPNQAGSVRGLIIEQCRASRRCRHLDCGGASGGGRARGCYSPGSVMREFGSSNFCLQPPGDSYTRRSAFDAMIAACVPVFFHPASAYAQYRWHLPRNHSSYSVFIPEEAVRESGGGGIEERLAAIPAGEVRAMREEVIRLLPRLVYADPRPSRAAVKDAFDVAVEGVIGRVRRLREEMRRDAAETPAAEESGGPEVRSGGTCSPLASSPLPRGAGRPCPSPVPPSLVAFLDPPPQPG